MTKVRNRPTPEGRELGAHIARLCDQEEAKQAKMLRPTIPERCRTCAFRAGTVPNGCGPSLMDALKCAAGGGDFLCHEHGRKGQLCAGFQMMRFDNPVEVDWPWSDEMRDDPSPVRTPSDTLLTAAMEGKGE